MLAIVVRVFLAKLFAAIRATLAAHLGCSQFLSSIHDQYAMGGVGRIPQAHWSVLSCLLKWF